MDNISINKIQECENPDKFTTNIDKYVNYYLADKYDEFTVTTPDILTKKVSISGHKDNKKFIGKAHECMKIAHKEHKRMQEINGIRLPFDTHPLSVALIHANAGYSANLVSSAMLHDIVDQTEAISYELLEFFINNYNQGKNSAIKNFSKEFHSMGTKKKLSDKKYFHDKLVDLTTSNQIDQNLIFKFFFKGNFNATISKIVMGVSDKNRFKKLNKGQRKELYLDESLFYQKIDPRHTILKGIDRFDNFRSFFLYKPIRQIYKVKETHNYYNPVIKPLNIELFKILEAYCEHYKNELRIDYTDYRKERIKYAFDYLSEFSKNHDLLSEWIDLQKKWNNIEDNELNNNLPSKIELSSSNKDFIQFFLPWYKIPKINFPNTTLEKIQESMKIATWLYATRIKTLMKEEIIKDFFRTDKIYSITMQKELKIKDLFIDPNKLNIYEDDCDFRLKSYGIDLIQNSFYMTHLSFISNGRDNEKRCYEALNKLYDDFKQKTTTQTYYAFKQPINMIINSILEDDNFNNNNHINNGWALVSLPEDDYISYIFHNPGLIENNKRNDDGHYSLTPFIRIDVHKD